MKFNPTDRLKVKVFSPFRTYFQGEAKSVSAVNKVGPFDVLPHHANFLSLLTSGTVSVDTGFEMYRFPIGRGIIKVTANTVTVFADL